MAVDWLKVKTEYLKDGKQSIDDVAKKFGINPSYCRYIASQQKWKDEKDKVQQKANERLTEKLPETIADVKLRHARIGRNLQSTGLTAILGDAAKGIKGIKPASYGEASNAVIKGIMIERVALGLNEKEVQDEVYQKFSQFTFIFSLKKDELLNFIRSAFSRGSNEGGAVGTAIPAVTGEAGGSDTMGTASIPG